MKGVVLVGLLALLPVVAEAQQDPCVRDAATMVIAGENLTELRCALFMAQQREGEDATIIDRLKAKIVLMQADLATAQKRLSDVLDYAAKCGDKPGCFAAPSLAGRE
jgi:hypothetical protein